MLGPVKTLVFLLISNSPYMALTLSELTALTGFKSFYNYYKLIVATRRQDLGIITIQQKKKRFDIVIKDVRDAAAQEVFARLPTDATILIMHELVAENCPNGPDKQLLHTFLNNLLTR
jgi:hypothetical protein